MAKCPENQPADVTAKGALAPGVSLHRNPWFEVRQRDGYYTVEYRTPQVVVLPIVDGHSAVMVRVRRPILGSVMLELPAGGAHEHECPMRAAARELREETGIDIRDVARLEPLPSLCCTPRNPQMPYLYQVSIAEHEYLHRGEHDHEIERVLCLPFREVADKIKGGEICISLQVAILARFLLQRAPYPSEASPE